MPRRGLAACLVLATAAVAHADASTVAVPSLQSPLALRSRIEARSEDSCSQSFASSSEETEITLRVDASGHAELGFERTQRHVFGPSRGRFSEGERDFSYTTERATLAYTGRATRASGALELRFDQVRQGRVEAAGMGDAPEPTTTTAAATLRLTCRVEPTDVYPAHPPTVPTYPADGESAARVPLVRCAFPDGVPSGLGHVEEVGGELVLGRAEGVVLHYARGYGGAASLVRLR
ncbi:MAG: hypothetical protein H6719_28390 [Sandaracinaceae bacterium]|nr:hypothetical protein [Sandaracinaceae bacterium]